MGGADGITRKKKGWNAFDQTCLGNKTPLEREQQKEKKTAQGGGATPRAALWRVHIPLLISNQVGPPAEFKHIIKRRKRN